MTSQINVIVDDGGLSAKARQQTQANRWAQLEAEARAKAEQKAEDEKAKQNAKTGTTQDGQRSRSLFKAEEPAAVRRQDDLIRIEARSNAGQLELFTSRLPYSLFDVESETIDLVLAGSGGPFADAVVRGSGGPEWILEIDMASVKPITGDFTIEAWTYWVDTGESNFPLFRLLASDSSTIVEWTCRANTSRIDVEVALGGGPRMWSIPVPALLDRWIHVAVVRSVNVVSIYLDGARVGDDKILFTNENYNPTAALEPLVLSLSTPQVYGDSPSDYYWKFNQIVISPKKARYTGAGFTLPTQRL